ncbi:hypothetical protein K2X33_13720, partial [bacterium]|nr:hypothetical protein [bacterium]
RYTPGEPFTVRYYVQGQGNLPEVNALAPKLPPEVQLLSQRSATPGGPFQNKAFELTFSTDKDTEQEIPAIGFVYFNAAAKKYERTVSTPVLLVPVKKPVEPLHAEQLALGVPAKTWSVSSAAPHSWSFLSLQAILAVIWSWGAATLGRTAWRAHRQRNPRHLIRERWKVLLDPKTTDPEWVRHAEQVLFETLDARSPRPLQTRRQAIAFARRQWGETVGASVERFFQDWENAHYRPEKGPLPEASATRAMLVEVRRSLLSRKPRWRT